MLKSEPYWYLLKLNCWSSDHLSKTEWSNRVHCLASSNHHLKPSSSWLPWWTLRNGVEGKGRHPIQTLFTGQGHHPQLLCCLRAYSHTLLWRTDLGPSHLEMPGQSLHVLPGPLNQGGHGWLSQWYKVSAPEPQRDNSSTLQFTL